MFEILLKLMINIDLSIYLFMYVFNGFIDSSSKGYNLTLTTLLHKLHQGGLCLYGSW